MNPLQPFRLSVVAPAYNEAAGIEQLLSTWQAFLNQQPYLSAFEIIICNDGSSDNTGDILETLKTRYETIKPLHLKHNQGAAAALATAITHSSFEWILLIDSDDQYPIDQLSTLITTAECHPDIAAIIGIRQKKSHWFLRFGTTASGFICNIIHRSRLKDFNSAFKLVKGPLLRSFTLEAKGMNYSTEITSRLLEVNAPLLEVAIIHQARQQGKSHLRWIRDSLHRFLFVGYLAMRQILIKWQILRRSQYDESTH